MASSPEGYLLSAILKTGDFLQATVKGVEPDMFHIYREEFDWLGTFFRKHKRTPTKRTFLQAFPDFRIQNVEEVDHFVDEVIRADTRYQLTESMKEVADHLTDGDIELAVKVMHQKIVSIGAQHGITDDTDIIRDYDDIMEDVEGRYRRYQEEGSAGIPFGFPTLDAETGGANPGDFIVFAARLGEGKSWILQHVAMSAFMANRTVQFDALEMSRSQVAMRIHALMSGLSGQQVFANTALMQGKGYDLQAYKRFLMKQRRAVKGRMHVSDRTRGGVSPLTLASQIERNDPQLMIVDYLGLMQTGSPDWMGMKQLSGDVKNLATSYKLPIIAAAQLNREHGLGKEPASAEALAGSDAIGQDCDVLVTMKQTSPYTLKMKLAKNRNGRGDVCWYVQFEPGRGIIREVNFAQYQRLIDLAEDAKLKEIEAESEKIHDELNRRLRPVKD